MTYSKPYYIKIDMKEIHGENKRILEEILTDRASTSDPVGAQGMPAKPSMDQSEKESKAKNKENEMPKKTPLPISSPPKMECKVQKIP